MKMIKMIKEDEAVSEVIGMILVLSITIVVIGSILLVGLPMIESGKNRAKMDIVANSFLSLQNDIEEVVRGPIWVKDPYTTTNIDRLGPSRETEFELMEGSISVLPNSNNLTANNQSIIYTITIPPSNITYNSDYEEIVYENGAVIRRYEGGGPLMISDPLINIYDVDGNTTISIHAITLNGTLSSVGGKGKTWAEVKPQNYTPVIDPASSSPISNQTVIKIYSKYPDAWRNFFDVKLKGAGLGNNGYNISGIFPLNITVNGNSTNNTIPDIFLSVYESRLNVRVR
jgi:FlaG/FlaF family flagellin (archaellin)